MSLSFLVSLTNEVEKFLKGAKVAVVAGERTMDKETDFKANLTRIKAKALELVFHGGMDVTGGLMLKQPRKAASSEFNEAFTARFGDIKQYSPLFYHSTNAVIEAMRKADSIDPAKFGPEILKVSFPAAGT